MHSCANTGEELWAASRVGRADALLRYPGQRAGTRLHLARYKIAPITLLEDVTQYKVTAIIIIEDVFW